MHRRYMYGLGPAMYLSLFFIADLVTCCHKVELLRFLCITIFIAAYPMFLMQSRDPGGILGLQNPQSQDLENWSRIAIFTCYIPETVIIDNRFCQNYLVNSKHHRNSISNKRWQLQLWLQQLMSYKRLIK